MMNYLIKKISAVIILTIFSGLQISQAQFAGDVFFASPSVAITEGGQRQIELQAFMGDSTFGAVQLDLFYDPTKLSIVSVKPGSATELQDGFTSRQSEGKLSIIVLNGGSKDKPFGTVSLALIEVAPLTAAGTIINVGSKVDTILRQNSSAFFSPKGFGIEIVVTNPLVAPLTTLSTVSTTNTSSVKQDVDDDIHQRALALRPAGSAVTIMVLDKSNNAIATQVRTESTSIPSEKISVP